MTQKKNLRTYQNKHDLHHRRSVIWRLRQTNSTPPLLWQPLPHSSESQQISMVTVNLKVEEVPIMSLFGLHKWQWLEKLFIIVYFHHRRRNSATSPSFLWNTVLWWLKVIWEKYMSLSSVGKKLKLTGQLGLTSPLYQRKLQRTKS